MGGRGGGRFVELAGRVAGDRFGELAGRDRLSELAERGTAPFIGRIRLPTTPPALGQ